MELVPCPKLVNFDERSLGAPLNFPAGTPIDSQFQDVGLTIVPDNAVAGHPDQAILFDTENFTGEDPDLMTPGPGINNDTPLLVANCDQFVDFSCADYVADCWARGLDGSILCFKDTKLDPKWSFAKTDKTGIVTQVAEKVAISDLATVGLYLFRRGSDFVAGAIDMLARNERVNNEFYTCPVYNHVIRNGGRIGVHEVRFEDMHGLGIPDDLIAYLELIGREPQRALA